MTARSATRSGSGLEGTGRAVSPLVGTVLLLLILIALAAVVAVGVSTWSLEADGPTAAFDLSVDGGRSTVTIEHVAGDPIDVEELSVTIAVEGTALAEQPPVPFVGASGFTGSPSGPFNARSDPTWTTGERAAVTVAGTNDPEIGSGDSVAVTLAVDGRRVGSLETTAT